MGESAGLDACQQRFAALKRANSVRLARAELKRRICTGQLTAAAVLESCPPEAYRMTVSEVLMSQKRWGIQRCRRVLVPIGIPENKEVGTLTDRQRSALVAALPRRNAKAGASPATVAVASSPARIGRSAASAASALGLDPGEGEPRTGTPPASPTPTHERALSAA